MTETQQKKQSVKISEICGHTFFREIFLCLAPSFSKKIKPTTRYLNVMWFGGEPLLAGNSVIVGPSGELYKCSKSIGNEHEQCGTIFDLEEGHPNFKKWMECGNLDLESCQDCSMPPVCRKPLSRMIFRLSS